MSLLRRRMLLAASQTGGGGFYADFHFDYCEEVWLNRKCYRNADELGAACYKETVRLLEEYGTQESTNYKYLDNPINHGFEVYIEGELVTHLSWFAGLFYLHTDGEYYNTIISSGGSLTFES